MAGSVSFDQLEQNIHAACGDLGRRLRSGEDCVADEYFDRIPSIEHNSEWALELLYTEYVVREELGQTVNPDQWYQRYPHWADDLRQLFEVHRQVCEMDTVRAVSSLSRDCSKNSRSDVKPVEYSRFESGRLIGGYQLIEEIGRGGMGVVFRARQLTLNRDVALKMIISGEFAGSRELSRFQTEAEAAARLHHPNIVQVHEVSAHDRCPFLSMELVRGGNLELRLKTDLFTPIEAAGMLETIARAVQFAHDHKVVHRDLKPSNVLLTSEGEPKVADFGLAKQLQDGQVGKTRTGAIVGTPAYMAPELITLGAAAAGPASDVYALGVILYEMLTGRQPLQADAPLEELRRIMHEEPQRPSYYRENIPRDLETICLKCLEKEPPSRYASALELAEDLRHFRLGEPILARSVGSIERLIKWTRRRPLAATFVAFLMLSLTAVTALWFMAESRGEQARLAAEQARVAAKKADELRATSELEQRKSERSLYFHRVGQANREWQANKVNRANALLDQCPPEMRDFEWHYLKSKCNADLMTLRGHSDTLWCLAVSRDGSLIASGSGEWGYARPGEIIIWDAATGKKRVSIPAHDGPIMSLSFSPDGQRLASSSVGWEGRPRPGVKIWDTSGNLLQSIPPPGNHSHAIAFGPDGTKLVIGVTDKVLVWDLTNRKLQNEFSGHKGTVLGVAFHPDGNRVASVGRDGSARMYQIDTGKELQAFTGYGDLRRVAFSPDGRYLAFTTFNGDYHYWDTSLAPDKLKKFTYHVGAVCGFTFSPEGRRVGMSSHDGSVLIIDAITGAELKRLYTHDGPVRDLSFNEDGRKLVTAGSDGLVRVWDGRTDWKVDSIDFIRFSNPGSLDRIRIAPDGRRLIVPNGFNHRWHGVGSKVLMVFDLETRKLEHQLKGHTGWLTDAAVTPSGERYVSSSMDRTARVWSAATAKEIFRLDHPDAVISVASDPLGKTVATGCADGLVRLWNLDSGSLLRKFPQTEGRINRVAFSSDGSRLLAACHDQTIRIWEVDSGRELHCLRGHTAPVTALALSHNGEFLASGSQDSTDKIWNVKTGELLRTLRGHTRTVTDIAISPNDRRIASCSIDGTFKLWDVESGEEALALQSDATHTMTFHPDGKRLLSALYRSIEVWSTDRERNDQTWSEDAFVAANIRWHSRQARECRLKGLLAASQFHYARLGESPAKTPEDFQHRANSLAQVGNYTEALVYFQKAMDRGTKNRNSITNFAVCQLVYGDIAAYRKTCRHLIDTLTDRSTWFDINNAAWNSVLSADGLGECEELLELAKLAMAKAPNDTDRSAVENTLAAVLLRCGRYQEAKEALLRNVKTTGGGYVEDWLLLGMVEWHLGNREQSHEWLAKYDKWSSGEIDSPATEPAITAFYDVRETRKLFENELRKLIATQSRTDE